MQFNNTACSCLDVCLREVQNSEGTLEIRVPDGMPDIGRILAAWGQPILRGKEWRSENISFSGGMMVWVLYAPEDDTPVRCLEGWIPFQMRWELPEENRDGQMRIGLAARFVDARSISARKIMVRAGLAALAEAWILGETQVFTPEAAAGEVELRRQQFPLRLMKEAGEKTFLLTEELTIPGSVPQPEKILCCVLRPEITEQKVLGSKVVFRGNGNLHMLYSAEDGQLNSLDFPLAFSQLADLEESYSGDAQVTIRLCATNLEPEIDEEGTLKLKGALVAQYLVDDLRTVEVVTDAYSPGRELETDVRELRLPVTLDSRREILYGEQTLPVKTASAVDVTLLADLPEIRKDMMDAEVRLPGSIQVLYYDEKGKAQSASSRWEVKQGVRANGDCRICAYPLTIPEAQLLMGGEHLNARWELPVEVVTTGYTEIPMVTGVQMGEKRKPDPNRPSLILKRVGSDGLWEIAKSTGSTIEAIRKANGLRDEPEPGQMLLIPLNV